MIRGPVHYNEQQHNIVCFFRTLIKNRQYREIVMPLQGITEVIKHFSNFKDISQINQLSAEVITFFVSIFIIEYVHDLREKTLS